MTSNSRNRLVCWKRAVISHRNSHMQSIDCSIGNSYVFIILLYLLIFFSEFFMLSSFWFAFLKINKVLDWFLLHSERDFNSFGDKSIVSWFSSSIVSSICSSHAETATSYLKITKRIRVNTWNYHFWWPSQETFQEKDFLSAKQMITLNWATDTSSWLPVEFYKIIRNLQKYINLRSESIEHIQNWLTIKLSYIKDVFKLIIIASRSERELWYFLNSNVLVPFWNFSWFILFIPMDIEVKN